MRSIPILALGAAGLAGAASAQQYGAGPDPGWALYRDIAEAQVSRHRSQAQFAYHHGYVGGYWVDQTGRRHHGWWTCGDVRGVDSEGRQRGWSKFVVVVQNGRAVHTEVGTPRFTDFTRAACSNAVVNRVLQPINQAMGAAGTGAAATTQPARPRELRAGYRFGMGYRASDQGLIVASVHEGGPAERIGLRPGSVVTHLNGTPLAGVPEPTLIALIDGAPRDSVMTIAGVGDRSIIKGIYDPARGGFR